MRGEVAWSYMANILSGKKYTDFITLLVADEVVSLVGVKGDSTQYLKLTEKLYEPTLAEKFAMR